MWVIALATLSQANALYNILNSSVIFVYNQPVQERSIAFSTSSIYFFLARSSVCIQTTNNFVYILRMDFYQAANIVEVLKRNFISTASTSVSLVFVSTFTARETN